MCDGGRVDEVDGGMAALRPSPCHVPGATWRGVGNKRWTDVRKQALQLLQWKPTQASERVAFVSHLCLSALPSSAPCGPSTSVKLVLWANCPLSRLTREGQQMGVLTKWLEKVTPGTGCREATRSAVF